jgi:hypothetical protein
MNIKNLFTLLIAILFTFFCINVQGQIPKKSKIQVDSVRVQFLYRTVYELKAKQDSIVDLLAQIGNDTLNSDSLRVFAIQHLAGTGNTHAIHILLKDISLEFPLDSYDEYLSIFQYPQYHAVLMQTNNPWLFLSAVIGYLKSSTISEQDAFRINDLLQRFLNREISKFVLENLIKQASGTYKENLLNIQSKF